MAEQLILKGTLEGHVRFSIAISAMVSHALLHLRRCEHHGSRG